MRIAYLPLHLGGFGLIRSVLPSSTIQCSGGRPLRHFPSCIAKILPAPAPERRSCGPITAATIPTARIFRSYLGGARSKPNRTSPSPGSAIPPSHQSLRQKNRKHLETRAFPTVPFGPYPIDPYSYNRMSFKIFRDGSVLSTVVPSRSRPLGRPPFRLCRGRFIGQSVNRSEPPEWRQTHGFWT